MKIRAILVAFAVVALGLPDAGAVSTTAANCTLTVPANPLSASGLATPYRLRGCQEADSATTAFVQAAIIAPSGAISVYPPLVISGDEAPVVAPVMPVVPVGATVGIWFGFNGNDLHLVGAGAAACTNGEPGSVFGQFAYCNAVAFFATANAAIAAGRLKVPPLGTAADGTPCPTVHSFSVVDQDPSDNVQTQYLESPTNGHVIQDTAVNRAGHPRWGVISNPSDNRLLTAFIDPAIGCVAWTAPNLADNGAPVNALALDELQAAFQAPPKALVPLGDPMTLLKGRESVAKTTLYRSGVNQPAVSETDADGLYCAHLASIFPPWMKANQARLVAAHSPVPAAGANLWLFLGGRFVATYEGAMLRPCKAVTGTRDPVVVTLDASGAVTGVRFTSLGVDDRPGRDRSGRSG